MSIRLAIGAHTDPGLRRAVNEDAFLAAEPVFVVADGMGGHDAGDRASLAVVEAFASLVGRDIDASDVAAAVDDAHARVALIAQGTERGAGSTLTGVVAVRVDGGPRWVVVNIGDSRVYRLLGDRLERLTVDHSLAQEMVDDGRLRPEELATFRGRNVITRAVGHERSPADFWLTPVVDGERLLVCSDGLSGELSDEAIRACLSLGGAPAPTAANLVAQAIAAGGRDNVTAVVIDVLSGGIVALPRELPEEVSATLEVATAPSARGHGR